MEAEGRHRRSRRKSITDFFTFNDNSKHDEFRIVKRNGESTLKCLNHPRSGRCFYPNVYASVAELSSLWLCVIFLCCFLLSWFVFALLYFVVAETRGDLNEVEIGKKEIPCVEGATDFLEMFMFSMETQSTIGYGTRYVTNECPTAVILVIIQSILGSFLHAVLTGVVLFKFQEPKKRAHTVLFSNVVCVIEDDGKYFIEVQILNMQRSQLINPDVGAFCVMNHPDGSGKCRLDVDFKPCQENARLFFRPRIYRHLIDQQSPFWEFERKDFECGNYELIVAISGVDEITDTFAQARTSFLPSEVVWGRNFKQMTATREGKRFKLNFNDFTRTHRLQRCMADSSASMASRNVSLTKTVEE